MDVILYYPIIMEYLDKKREPISIRNPREVNFVAALCIGFGMSTAVICVDRIVYIQVYTGLHND